MYRYKYQQTMPEEMSIFSCIVPDGWLQKALPDMDGCVNYAASRGQLSSIAKYLYRFEDIESKDKSVRIVSLEMWEDGKELFERPVRIYSPCIAAEFESDEWGIEVLLLNHLFGFCALTASIGNVYLDYSDVLAVLKMSSEFDFRYGIGDSPAAVSSEILAHDAKSGFGMIFCDGHKMRLAYLDDLVEVMTRSCADNGMVVITDIAVEQEQMLISVLYGR